MILVGWRVVSETPDMRCEKGSIVEEMKRKVKEQERGWKRIK